MTVKNNVQHVMKSERVFDAPRALAFKMWTDPEYLAMWWGPKGFTNPVCEIGVQPGGRILIMMTAPDGSVYPMRGVVNEVQEPERIVFTAWPEDGKGNVILEVTHTVTFVEENNKTKQIVESVVRNSTLPPEVYEAEMNKGWNSSMEKLEALLREQ